MNAKISYVIVMYFFIILLHVVHVCGILGGYDINIKEAPYQVSYADMCGAVLIHKKWALTTAHCGSDGTYIRIGSSIRLRGRRVSIIFHIIHPRYGNNHTFDYDVQLLKLFRGLHFGKTVKDIKISDGKCGDCVEVFGWGYSKEKGNYNDTLQKVVMQVVPFVMCQNVQQFWYNHTLTARMFCAGGAGQDACQGDSGGAAVSFGHLVGLSSFGFGCGRNFPGVYVNITHKNIRRWINFHTEV